MAFQKIGKVFPNKSGKSSTLILSEKDLEVLKQNLQPNDKYGDQVRLIVTGSAQSQYGHGVSLIVDDGPQQQKANSGQNSIDPDDLPF